MQTTTTASTHRPGVPLLPADHYAIRPRGMPWWTVYRLSFKLAPAGEDHSGAYVTDDFGFLTRITGDTYQAAERFWLSHSQGQEEAAAQWEHQAELTRQARERAEFEAANTRALLRPEPIVVEISEPGPEHGDIDVQVGPDARVPGERGPALYRVSVAGNDTIWCTHAQLAALGMAAQHLCRQATGRRTH